MKRKKKRRLLHRCACDVCERHRYGETAKQHRAINRVLATLDERNRRRFVGMLVLQWKRGGAQSLSRITGLSRNTIRRGKAEIGQSGPTPAGAVRRPGGGRRRVEKNSPAS